MIDLSTLGGTTSVGVSINATGQIVGYSTTASNTLECAFLYTGGNVSSLGTPGGEGSWAYSINASGQVVGIRSYNSIGTHHARSVIQPAQ